MTNITPEQKQVNEKINTNIKTNIKTNIENEPALKGTFVSVMLLGGFLVLSWVCVFYLFISRN